ncbi:unnamed protein product [Prunus armeniaca]
MKTDEVCTRRGMWCASEMKRQRNEHDEVTVTLRALDMFCKQLQLHLSHNIDENTVTLAIKACQGDPKPGCQIHGFAVSSGFASYTTVSNSLMSVYTKTGQFDVTCTTILAFCADHEDFLFGLQLHSIGALIDMYAKQGSICVSKRVFSETPHKSQFAWTAIISAYVGHGDYDSVTELFKEMEREGQHAAEMEWWRWAVTSFIQWEIGGSRGIDESDPGTARVFVVAAERVADILVYKRNSQRNLPKGSWRMTQ